MRPKTNFIVFLFFLFISTWLQAQGPDTLGLDSDLDSLLNLRISTVSKYEQDVSEAPASVTILTSEDIRRYGVNDLMEALQMIRSIYLSHDRNYSMIGMRGFSRPTDYNNRVLLMVDGVMMNDNIWGAASVRQDYFTINMEQVERIEVIRGAGSALYGTAAMLGMINVVMKDGQSLHGLHATVQGGSWGRVAGNLAWGKRTAAGLNISVGGRAGITGGQRHYYPEYDTDSTLNGIADHLDDTRFVGFHGSLKYKGFKAQAFYTESIGGIPTASYETQFGDSRFRVLDRQAFIDISQTVELRHNLSLILRDNLTNVYYQQKFPYAPDDGGLLTETTDGIWNTAEARLQWDVTSNNRLVGGVIAAQHFRANFDVQDESGLDADTTFPYHTYSVYLQDEYQPLKWLILQGGARYDRAYLGKQAITPRFSALINPRQGTTIKLLWGRAFRSPNPSETSVDDTFSDKGNPDLSPEFITTQEIVVEQRLYRMWHASGSFYLFHMTDLVERVQLPGDTLDSYQNVGEARGLGAEVEVAIRVPDGRRFYASLSYNKVSNDSIKWFTNSPRIIWKSGGGIRALKHFFLAGEYTIESPRLTLGGNETPWMILFNLNAAFQPRWEDKGGFQKALSHSTWTLRFNNLLNHQYATPGGYEHLQDAIPQNGRSVLLGSKWSF